MTLDLKKLNCPNIHLDVGLDALESKLDLFLHKTCLLAEFMCHLRKIISLKFGRLIGLQVRNPKKLSLHQLDFCSSRYSSRNGWRSTLAKCEIWLWRLRFPCSFFFYLFTWKHIISTSRVQALHKTSTEGQICQLPPIYFFLYLSSKSAFKT